MKALIILALAVLAVPCLAQRDEGVMLNPCETTEGMTIDTGAGWPGTALEINPDARYLTEGAGSVRLSGTSPAGATGNSYLCLGLPIPATDFTGEVTGVRLAGVIPGSPAAAAGLAKGDLLVGMAGEALADLPAFTRVLRSQSPGDRITVDYLRGDEMRQAEVVLGDRADRK